MFEGGITEVMGTFTCSWELKIGWKAIDCSLIAYYYYYCYSYYYLLFVYNGDNVVRKVLVF